MVVGAADRPRCADVVAPELMGAVEGGGGDGGGSSDCVPPGRKRRCWKRVRSGGREERRVPGGRYANALEKADGVEEEEVEENEVEVKGEKEAETRTAFGLIRKRRRRLY